MVISIGSVLTLAGIALAVTLPGIGSAKGVGMVGQAASGVVTEDPDKFGQVILLQALPGTQGIYGFLAGFMIMNKLRILTPGQLLSLDMSQGIAFLLASLPVAFVCLWSALDQARVASTGVSIVAKRPEEVGKAVIFAAMVETYAVLSFLASLLLINGIKI
jgi:V/A-type H+-transporting ATPase subunit K